MSSLVPFHVPRNTHTCTHTPRVAIYLTQRRRRGDGEEGHNGYKRRRKMAYHSFTFPLLRHPSDICCFIARSRVLAVAAAAAELMAALRCVALRCLCLYIEDVYAKMGIVARRRRNEKLQRNLSAASLLDVRHFVIFRFSFLHCRPAARRHTAASAVQTHPFLLYPLFKRLNGSDWDYFSFFLFFFFIFIFFLLLLFHLLLLLLLLLNR